MKFSIVVPAYNEAETISECLRALQAQSVPRGDFEIIVVDNNSKDATSKVAARAGADKVVLETKKGTNLARQRGYVESTGKIVAFVDADSQPPKHWLEKIEKDLKQPGVAAVSGPYDFQLRGIEKIFGDIYLKFVVPSLPKVLSFLFGRKAGVIFGGNFAAWRTTIQAIGGLPPLAFWGDDSAIAMLVSRHVGRVFFDFDLRIKSSPRRLQSDGFFVLPIHYSLFYFKMYFSPDYR